MTTTSGFSSSSVIEKIPRRPKIRVHFTYLAQGWSI
jgi:hypothetical protein